MFLGKNKKLGWTVVAGTWLSFLQTDVEYAERAASHPRELVAVTKQTLHDTAAVTKSIPAVQLEIEPQVWSMRQPAFTEMVAELKARIADKG